MGMSPQTDQTLHVKHRPMNANSWSSTESTFYGVLRVQEVYIPKQLKQFAFEVPCRIRPVALVAVLRHRLMRSTRSGPDKTGTQSSHKMVRCNLKSVFAASQLSVLDWPCRALMARRVRMIFLMRADKPRYARG